MSSSFIVSSSTVVSVAFCAFYYSRFYILKCLRIAMGLADSTVPAFDYYKGR